MQRLSHENDEVRIMSNEIARFKAETARREEKFHQLESGLQELEGDLQELKFQVNDTQTAPKVLRHMSSLQFSQPHDQFRRGNVPQPSPSG